MQIHHAKSQAEIKIARVYINNLIYAGDNKAEILP